MKTFLKQDQYSSVWLEDGWVYKRQHEFMTDNEIHFLRLMYPSGYVPYAEQVGRDLIKLEYINTDEYSNYMSYPYTHFMGMRIIDYFPRQADKILSALESARIRHGDLTKYAVLIDNNWRPYIIDFAESRFWDDPRPDKRPEGDRWWLTRTMREIIGLSPTTADSLTSGRSSGLT